MTTTTPETSTTSSMDPSLSSNERFVKGNSKDLQQIAVWANDQFDSIKNARVTIERQWYLNLAFYYGRQNVVFRQTPNSVVGASGALYTPPAPYWRARPVINRIRPIIRTEIVKLSSQKPNVSVVPATNDDSDLFAAQAGEQIWESTYRNKKIAHILRRALFWSQTCGTSFVKCFWDPDDVDKSANQMGDFCYSPVTPFHIYAPDFREEELENQAFIIHATMRTKDELSLAYPGINFPTSKKGHNEILDDSWINLVGAGNLQDKSSVICLEVWVKPEAIELFPQGAMFTLIGDTIVDGVEGWPYQHNQYPFAKLDHIPSGKFYSDSSIIDLIPLQREYNRTRGQIIEAKNRMGKPQLAAPRGSVTAAKMTSEPGQVIEYTPGMQPPTPIPLMPLPNYIITELDRITQDMNDISGQHEVTQGSAPSGVTAATAISYLQEQDDSKLAHTYNSVEEGIEKIASLTLAYVVQFWDVPRMLKVVGNDGAFDVLNLKGSDLAGNTDLRVEAGSSLPTSKAARTAFIMDLMKMGFIDPQKGLEVMEMGGINKIYESVQVDVRQAQRENTKMAAVNQQLLDMHSQNQMQDMQTNPAKYMDEATGQTKLMQDVGGNPIIPLIVPVNRWDNHTMHIEIHNKYRKSAAYDNLDDQQKQLFEDHVNQHAQAVVVNSMVMPPMGPGMQDPNAMAPDNGGVDNGNPQPNPSPNP